MGTILLVDFFEESSVVEVAKIANRRRCNDSPLYRARRQDGQDCRSWAEAGQCQDPNKQQFMIKHCPLSCGYCVVRHGEPATPCIKDSDCYTNKCVIATLAPVDPRTLPHKGEAEKICLVEKPLRVGDTCGKDVECLSGRCSYWTRRCLPRPVKDTCERDDQCRRTCASGKCEGEEYFKWFGTAPLCGASQQDCIDSEEGLVYMTTSKCGDGNQCISGDKVLCSSFLHGFKSFQWKGTAPVCNASEKSCENSTYILSNKCGNGNICLPAPFVTNVKVLCGIP